LYAWTLDETRSVGWLACLVFAICAALRLARFNVALDAPDEPVWKRNYFVGVPAPAGAGTVLLPLYLEALGIPHSIVTAPLVAIFTIAIGLLMISRVPTWSGKMAGRRIPRDMVLPLFVLVVVFVALLVSFPWLVLTVGSLAYLASLPLSWRAWQRHKAEDQARSGEARALDAEAF